MESKTFVFSTIKNLDVRYSLNDVIIPRFNPDIIGAKLAAEPGLAAITKYLTRVV